MITLLHENNDCIKKKKLKKYFKNGCWYNCAGEDYYDDM
jgi:hypothetical protein